MTIEEQGNIKILRTAGLSYIQIAKRMNISVNTIKSYCKRNRLGGVQAMKNRIAVCEYCSKPIKQNKGRKERRFCSDFCRNAWWNTHRQLVKRKANYEYICLNCKRSFTAYGKQTRKYCCHDCYIEHRFRGEHYEEH